MASSMATKLSSRLYRVTSASPSASQSLLLRSSSLPPRWTPAAAATQIRCQQTDAKTKKSTTKAAKDSSSFAFNLFKGEFRGEEVFPYPAVLSEEEKEELSSMVEPMNKWNEEVNDPLLNDKLETVPPDVMQSLAELGAFGLQVPVIRKLFGLEHVVVEYRSCQFCPSTKKNVVIQKDIESFSD